MGKPPLSKMLVGSIAVLLTGFALIACQGRSSPTAPDVTAGATAPTKQLSPGPGEASRADLGTGTIGYWKNHPEVWPVPEIEIGGVVYSQGAALAILGRPSRGDKSIDLAKQVIASKLNVLVGNPVSCISDTLAAADAWLVAHPPGSGVKGRGAAWRNEGQALHVELDDYNSGLECAPE